MLVERLLAAGHRRFGLICGPEDNTVGRLCVEAARARLEQAGLTPAVTGDAFDHDSGEQGFQRLMTQSGNELDAVICANDLWAIGAIDAARDPRWRET